MTDRHYSSDSNSSSKNCIDEHSDSFSESCGKQSAFGVSLIPGTGSLLEFVDCSVQCAGCSGACFDRNGITSCLCNDTFHPRSYTGCVAIDNCHKFAAFKKVNFIDGDLIISDDTTIDNFTFTACNGVTLSLTEALDIFPNLLGINGNLYIIGTSYTKITGFHKLRWVTGSIIIANNQNLVCIPSFESLLNIGGIICGGNDGCPCDNSNSDCTNTPPNITCCGCIDKTHILPPTSDGLQCCPSFLAIAYNASLKKISGFEALRQVNDGIFIADNASLNSIAGFIHLYRTDRVVIRGNAILNKIIGFCYIDTLNVGLFILENNCSSGFDLVLGAFLSLETAEKIVITNNTGLKCVKLDSLVNVCGDFVVSYNKNLVELSSSIKHVGDFYIHDNAITSLKLPHLKEVNGRFLLAREQLVCFDTLEDLKRVGTAMIIAENNSLTEFKGANKLKYVGDKCIAYEESPIPPCTDVCGSIQSSTPVGWNLVTSASGCTAGVACAAFITVESPLCNSTFTGIPPVNVYDNAEESYKYVLPADFFVSLNNKGTITNNSPQTGPSHVSASIIFYGNTVLKCIGGFSNLRHIKSNLYIVRNQALHTISSFGHLAFALDIWIRNNANLKFVLGFNGLLACRDFLILDSLVNEFNGFSCLEFAQRIVIEARSIKSYNNHKLIPTTCGYVTYNKFEHRAN